MVARSGRHLYPSIRPFDVSRTKQGFTFLVSKKNGSSSHKFLELNSLDFAMSRTSRPVCVPMCALVLYSNAIPFPGCMTSTAYEVTCSLGLFLKVFYSKNGLASGMWRLVKYYSLHPEPWICDRNWNQHGGNLCSENLSPKQRNPPWSKTSAWCYFPQYGHRAMIWHFLHLIILQYLKLHGGSNVVAADDPTNNPEFHGGWGGGNPSKHLAIAYSDGQKISLQ